MAMKAFRGEEADFADNLAGFQDFGTTFVAGLFVLLPFSLWNYAEQLTTQTERPVVVVEAGEAGATSTPEEPPDASAFQPSVTRAAPSTPPAARRFVMYREAAPKGRGVSVPAIVYFALPVYFGVFIFVFAVLADRRCGVFTAFRACLALADAPPAGRSRLSALAHQLLFTTPVLLVLVGLSKLALPTFTFGTPLLLIGGGPLAACVLACWYMTRMHPEEWAGTPASAVPAILQSDDADDAEDADDDDDEDERPTRFER